MHVGAFACVCARHTDPGGHIKLSTSSNHPVFFILPFTPSLHSLPLPFFHSLHCIPSSVRRRPLRLYCSLFLGNTHAQMHTHTHTSYLRENTIRADWRDGRHIVRGGVFKQKHFNRASFYPLNGRMGV